MDRKAGPLELMWQDFSDAGWPEKITRAIKRYCEKFGHRPNIVLLHPVAFANFDASGGLEKWSRSTRAGIAVLPSPRCPNQEAMLIGRIER